MIAQRCSTLLLSDDLVSGKGGGRAWAGIFSHTQVLTRQMKRMYYECTKGVECERNATVFLSSKKLKWKGNEISQQ